MWGRFILQAIYVIVFEILPMFVPDSYKPISYRHSKPKPTRFKPKTVPKPGAVKRPPFRRPHGR